MTLLQVIDRLIKFLMNAGITGVANFAGFGAVIAAINNIDPELAEEMARAVKAFTPDQSSITKIGNIILKINDRAAKLGYAPMKSTVIQRGIQDAVAKIKKDRSLAEGIQSNLASDYEKQLSVSNALMGDIQNYVANAQSTAGGVDKEKLKERIDSNKSILSQVGRTIGKQLDDAKALNDLAKIYEKG